MNQEVAREESGLFRAGPWLALAVAVLLSVGAFFLDDRVVEQMRTTPRAVERVFARISQYGDWPWLAAAAAVVILACTVRDLPGLRRVVLCMLVASTLAGISANVLRLTTGRTRPEAKGVEPGWYGLRHDGQWLIGRAKFNAFPSGHSATGAGFFGVLLFLRRRGAFVAGLLLVPLIPLARLLMNQHHLSDVVVGSCIGLFVAWWITTRHAEAIDRWWMAKIGRHLSRRS